MNKHHIGKGAAWLVWYVVAILLAAVVYAVLSSAQAQTVSFAPNVTSGDGEVNVVLTWDAPGAQTCMASSTPQTEFSGERTAAGTESVGAIMFSTVFRIECAWTGDTSVRLAWTAPTTNTNGTALTDLAGYTVHHGASCDALVQSTQINEGDATTWTIENLTQGDWCFAIRAVNAAGRTSELSNTAQKSVTEATSVTESVEVQVNPVPATATGLTAE